MKWIRRSIIAVLLLTAIGVGAAYRSALRSTRPVGFQVLRTTDATGQPFPIGVWYPTDARPWPTTQVGNVLMNVARNATVAGDSLPLVVFSHGNGGSLASHADLAMALAGAGYVVAAPMHVGDNFADHARTGRATLFHERASQLRAAVTAMLTQWPGHEHIDGTRIGAFGFSAGGFAVLGMAGAQPDLRRVATHCATRPEFICQVLRASGSPLVNGSGPPTLPPFEPDRRVRAIVLAAPGLGFTVDSAAARGVTVPVQLWSGRADESVPFATNAQPLSLALGQRVELHQVPHATHLSFLVPCGLLRPPGLCDDPDGFDRRAFHEMMNESVVAFFNAHLGR